jgi:hypothetical protein
MCRGDSQHFEHVPHDRRRSARDYFTPTNSWWTNLVGGFAEITNKRIRPPATRM